MIVDEVAALPGGLELLFEVEERLALRHIAEAPGQEIDTIAQEGFFFSIYIAERSQAQACNFNPTIFHIFERVCQ